AEEHWAPEDGNGQGLARRLQQEGLAGPLHWLESCLRRTARDREEDGVSHPVPLVPLSEENEDAMEDRRFRALLRRLGLRPPASEQESFWRIPAALTPQQLRRAAAAIAHHGPDPTEPPGPPQAPAAGERPGWGCRSGAGGAGAGPGSRSHGAGRQPLSLCPAAEQPPAGLGSDSESEEPVPVPSAAQPGAKRRREIDSEDEDEGSAGGFSPSARSWG
ncbi:TIM protein, partial [Ardeotis kori]|nr:TIM protein [Ardeotis kori]